MICPYMVNISMLIGAIVSWGIMWSQIEKKKGDWYSAQFSASSLHGIQGYRVFLAIAMMLGDGLFHAVYMLIVTVRSFIAQHSNKQLESTSSNDLTTADYDEQRRTEYFLKDQIPNKVAIPGYIILAVISIIVVPHIFPQLKWYHVLVAYLIAPILAFCNAYGCGLTNWSLASCGVMMSIVATASDLMQDFKTGYLTLASPRSMFFSQVFGTAMGCIISPLVFWFFYKAYAVGDPESTYPAPYALMYRGIALLGVEGISSLPKHCLALAIGFFIAAIAMNILREALQCCEKKYRVYRFIPSPLCMAIPFYLGVTLLLICVSGFHFHFS